MGLAELKRFLWPPEWEKKIEAMLYTGTIILVGAVSCLLAVLWYISPHQ
jgi:hypothetical protein